MKRTVFFVSESTGITAETMGHSLLSQFDTVDFEQVYMPYINTDLRAKALTERMQEAADRDGVRPIVFATMLDPAIGAILRTGNCFYLELLRGLHRAPVAGARGAPQPPFRPQPCHHQAQLLHETDRGHQFRHGQR